MEQSQGAAQTARSSGRCELLEVLLLTVFSALVCLVLAAVVLLVTKYVERKFVPWFAKSTTVMELAGGKRLVGTS